METRSLIKFISQLKIQTAKKSLYFDVYLTTESVKLARILKAKGIIRVMKPFSRSYAKGLKYRVFPNHTLLTNTNTRVALFSRNTPHLTVSLNGLKLIDYGCGNSTLLLETPKGLMTHQEALIHKTGGELFAYIYI
jgi:ribosomal protein S8